MISISISIIVNQYVHILITNKPWRYCNCVTMKSFDNIWLRVNHKIHRQHIVVDSPELIYEVKNLELDASDNAPSNYIDTIFIKPSIWEIWRLNHHTIIFHISNSPIKWLQSNTLIPIYTSSTILLSTFKSIASI